MPVARSWRYRVQRRTCACPRLAWSAWGRFARRKGPVTTDVRRIPRRPGPCNPGTTRRRRAGLRHAAGLTTGPTRLCRRRAPQIMHTLSGGIEARQGRPVRPPWSPRPCRGRPGAPGAPRRRAGSARACPARAVRGPDAGGVRVVRSRSGPMPARPYAARGWDTPLPGANAGGPGSHGLAPESGSRAGARRLCDAPGPRADPGGCLHAPGSGHAWPQRRQRGQRRGCEPLRASAGPVAGRHAGRW